MIANMLLIALLGISSPQPNIVNQREPPQICIQKRQQLRSDPIKYVFEKIISQSQYTMDDFKGYKRITAGEVEKSDENKPN